MGGLYGYRYYDTPDGQDWGPKTYYLVRESMMYSFFLANGNVLTISKPVGFVPTVVKWFQCFRILPGACIVWSTTAFMATRLRGKDVPSNHVLATIATAMYLNKFLVNNWAITAYAGAFCSLIAYCSKENKLKGVNMMPDFINVKLEPNHGVMSHYYNTYTLQKKYPRDWLRAEEVAAQEGA